MRLFFGDDPEEKKEPDPLFLELKNFLFASYKPALKPGEGVTMMSTEEIYHALLQVYPNTEAFNPIDVANWLYEGNFKFYDWGNMKLEWMLIDSSSNV